MSGDATIAMPRRLWGWRPRVNPAIELGVLALAIAVAIATYFVVKGSAAPQRPLSPPLVALLLVANLGPCVALLILLGRRIAKRRAERSEAGGEGQLHVRLVALFSVIATVPTVLAVIFASVMFQYGVQFWLSDRVSGVLKDATTLAGEQTVKRWSNEVLQTADDLQTWNGGMLTTATDAKRVLSARDPAFGNYSLSDFFLLQLRNRGLSQGTLFTINGKDQINFLVRADPYQNIERLIAPTAVEAIRRGEPNVISADTNRVSVMTTVPNSNGVYVFATKVLDTPEFTQQAKRVAALSADFKALQSRARVLQLQFNAALFVVALLIVALAVWIALAVADRLVRPVGQMVAASRRVADGDLTARVPDPRTDDEVATLANAFNRMTERLEQQTGALESRRALIEAVMSGVSAGVVSVGADGAIRLLNASAAELLRVDEQGAVGAPLAQIAPELAETLANDARESIVEIIAGEEKRTLAVRITADEDGRVLTFDDITQQLLDQRRAAWSDVARRIAHEIKNPLTPIQLAAERLQRRYGKTIDEKDGVFAQLTDTIVRQVGDLRRMVDEFSSFARMPKPVFHEESLIDIARQALFLHEVAHPAIGFALDAPDTVHLTCDRRQIGQALTNIVKNAVEAIEARGEDAPKGDIAMKLHPEGRSLILTVTDNGIGLPVERDRIAEPYMTTRARGTGLGLAIVKKIIEEHCGTIAFADRPGGGTIVTINFDVAALATLLDENSTPEDTSNGEGALAMLTRTGRKS